MPSRTETFLRPANHVEIHLEVVPFTASAQVTFEKFLFSEYVGDIEALYATMQYKMCIAHAHFSPNQKPSFSTLCIWMIKLEAIFREEIGMSKEAVFEKYLATTLSPTYILAEELQQVILDIYGDTTLTKDGFHTPVLRALYRQLSKCAMRNPKNKKLFLAGKLVERLIDLELGDCLEGIDQDLALGILAVIANAGNGKD
jgi:hypothetical protein